MRRREFLNGAASSLVVACSAESKEIGSGGQQFPTTVERDATLFPQSVASGDPKPHSVMFWTRCPASDAVYLQLATDSEFKLLLALTDEGATELRVAVRSAHDHCVKVRVADLAANTIYYYRFIVETDDGPRSSRTGRTKTAPLTQADVSVSFAVLSCQDYGGRYFHALRRAAELTPDFVVHLGDYIYETTDDPSFQSPDTSARSITFRDPDGAIALEVSLDSGETSTSLAARSLDNYRQLYQTYRADRNLQRLHEAAPFVIVWDDHEFANDATQERTPTSAIPDPTRRSNADQAWFEYMPVDFPETPTLRDGQFPDNLRIYRDFRFGKHVHLVMTDLRRYRPPALIQEDAFPGRVLVSESTLLELYGSLPEIAQPYVNLDSPTSANLRELLRLSATTWGVEPALFEGNQDIAYLNTWVERYNAEQGDATLTPLSAAEADGRGIAAIHVGKRELFSSFGARYFVVQAAYEAVALAAFRASGGQSENLLGATQRQWFIDTLSRSNATWKLWGNEYTFLRKIANLAPVPLPDPTFQQRFLVSAEDWDGAPNERLALLAALQDVKRWVILTGDIHSFFVGTTGLTESELPQPLEFVCGAVSSATYDTLLAATATLDGIGDLAPLADAILGASNPHVTYQNLASNGFAMVTADANQLDVTFHQLPSSKVFLADLDGPLADHFVLISHKVDLQGQPL